MMKKIVLALLVIAIAMPAMAAVTLSGSATGTTATVNYNWDGAGSKPRGFGLVITATGGTITGVTPAFTGACTSASNKGFGIFPGTIDIVNGAVNDAGTPVEPTDLPGGPSALNSNRVVVALGSLYDAAQPTWAPANSGPLFTVGVTAGTSKITITPETSFRGGVVGEDAATITVAPVDIGFVTDSITTPTLTKTTASPAIAGRVNATRVETFVASATGSSTVEYQFTWGDGQTSAWSTNGTQTHQYTAATNKTWAVNATVQARLVSNTSVSATSTPMALTGEAVKSTASFYANWAYFDRPACWAFQRACRGESNNARSGSALSGWVWVNSTDLSILAAGFNKYEPVLKTTVSNTMPAVCADNNRLRSGSALSGWVWVNSTDLGILAGYFNKYEPQTPVCDATWFSNYNYWTN